MASGAHSPVRRQVSEHKAKPDKQRQQPRRHRLRAPRGQKKTDKSLQITRMITGSTRGQIQRYTEDVDHIQDRREPKRGPASSGWNPQSSSRRLYHPTPARRWWRCGGIDPNEHGSSGVDSPCRPIISDTAPRGPSISSSSRYALESAVHCAWCAQVLLASSQLYNNGRKLCTPKGYSNIMETSNSVRFTCVITCRNF